VLHKGEIKPKDFSESLGAYSLSEVGRKTFLKLERKMNDEFKHPTRLPLLYRRAIELQARLLGRHLQEGLFISR